MCLGFFFSQVVMIEIAQSHLVKQSHVVRSNAHTSTTETLVDSNDSASARLLN